MQFVFLWLAVGVTSTFDPYQSQTGSPMASSSWIFKEEGGGGASLEFKVTANLRNNKLPD